MLLLPLGAGEGCWGVWQGLVAGPAPLSGTHRGSLTVPGTASDCLTGSEVESDPVLTTITDAVLAAGLSLSYALVIG